ncbi:hypothetical protein A5809_001011 [Enterococcus faecium]|nr:hypothetical protein A5809_001011 [Enterococcus faecium]
MQGEPKKACLRQCRQAFLVGKKVGNHIIFNENQAF